MDPATNKQLVRAFYEFGNDGNVEAAAGLLADDVTWTNIGSTIFSGTFRGKQDVMQRLVGPLFARLEAGIQSEVVRIVAEGEHAIAQVNGTARTLDGKDYNNTYCIVYRFSDGKIAEVMEYMDTDLIVRVFGH